MLQIQVIQTRKSICTGWYAISLKEPQELWARRSSAMSAHVQLLAFIESCLCYSGNMACRLSTLQSGVQISLPLTSPTATILAPLLLPCISTARESTVGVEEDSEIISYIYLSTYIKIDSE